MFMQIVAALACFAAALLQFAVYRDPVLIDTQMRRNGRRIVMVALFLASLYSAEAAYMKAAPSVAFLVLALMALSQIVFAASDLLPHLEKEHPWTSRLNSSQ